MRIVIIKSPAGVESLALRRADGVLFIPGLAGEVAECHTAYKTYASGGVGPAVPLEAVLEFVKGWKLNKATFDADRLFALVEFWQASSSLEAAIVNCSGASVHNALVDRLKAADAAVRATLGPPTIDARVEFVDAPGR